VGTDLPAGRPVRIGIVGLGRVYDLTVLGYRDNPDADVVALCDTDEDRLAARGADWPSAARFRDLDELLADRDLGLELVEVLVPTPTHCPVVCAALRAGCHVNVQKPMAVSLAEADKMIAAADAAGRHLRVMENYLFYEPLRRMRAVVHSGELGEPTGYHLKMVATGVGGWDVPWETWVWQFRGALAGRGILAFDDGWHKFSVARWLFGPVREVRAWISRTEIVPGEIVIDAPALIAWEHTNGLRGALDVTFAPDMLMPSDYYTNDERFEVTCRRGFARVNRCTARGLQVPSLEVYADGVLRQHHALDDDWASSFRDQTRAHLHWLRHGGPEVPWSAVDAREVLAFCLAAIESSERATPVVLA
jgi:predicted dehydrogenase